jgi:hypothetical protein
MTAVVDEGSELEKVEDTMRINFQSLGHFSFRSTSHFAQTPKRHTHITSHKFIDTFASGHINVQLNKQTISCVRNQEPKSAERSVQITTCDFGKVLTCSFGKGKKPPSSETAKETVKIM